MRSRPSSNSKIGTVFGAGENARAASEEAAEAISCVERAVEGKEQPTVVELFVEGNTLTAVGAGIEYDIIRTAGGKNVFNPTDEAFAEFFSAVIVFTTLDKAHEDATRAYLQQKFAEVPAVKNGWLVAIDSDDVMPGTWGNIRAVEQIAKALHPDAF